MTCICTVCAKTFEANPNWHHPTGICGDECRKVARQSAKEKYKKTQKGLASLGRWITGERRKQNEIGYRQKPTARAKAVIRAKRFLGSHPEAREKKRIADARYARSERGREVNLQAAARYRSTEHGVMMAKVTKARRRSAEGSFTREELIMRFAQLGNRCVHCGTDGRLTADHIMPLKLGGMNTIDNIQPLCKTCNSSKGARYVG